MKLPKLPKLPKIKNPFKKKSAEDDAFDDDDFDLDAADTAPAADAGQTVVVDDELTHPDAVATANDDEEEGLDMPLLPSGASIKDLRDRELEEREEAADQAAAAPPPEDGAEAPAAPDFGPDPFEGYDEDLEDEAEGRDKRKHLVIMASGALVLLGGIVGGASWWYLGSGDAEPVAAKEQAGPRVTMAMPAKPGTPNALLTPPRQGGASRPPTPSAAPSPDAPSGASSGVTSAVPAAPLPQPDTLPADAARPGTAAPGAQGSVPAATATTPKTPTYARVSGEIGGRFGGQADPLGGTLNVFGAGNVNKGTGIVAPAITSSTIRALPDHPGGKPLGPTPDARLVEKKEGLEGVLPKPNKDGLTPWQVYARPFIAEHPDWPRVGIVIAGLGMSRAGTMSAITKLPPQVTLALDPYARDLDDWTVRARLVGHEVMVMLPMESDRFPVHDAGPLALDTGVKPEDNIQRLEKMLSSLNGYTGVVTTMGSRFGTSEKMMTPVMTALRDRGLLFLAAGIQAELAGPKIAERLGMPRVIADLTLDDPLTGEAIDAKLARLEEIVKSRGHAVAVAHAYPVTLARLIPWLERLPGQKIELAPVSALADTTKTAE